MTRGQHRFPSPESTTQPVVPLDLDGGRRAFVRALGLGAVGAALLGVAGPQPAAALTAYGYTDVFIETFLLNFEYLGAEFYLRASVGQGLSDAEVSGTGTLGPVAGGRQVPFATDYLRNFANELAVDERAHVNALRARLGPDTIARPAIDLGEAFVLAAQGAGLIGSGGTFDPFADENSFLLAAFILEDVCVTAIAGAIPHIQSRTVLRIATGFLGVEAYQAGAIRTFLAARGLFQAAGQISNARDLDDGPGNDDQGIGDGAVVINVTPTDANGLAFARDASQVLNVATLGKGQQGGFFPNGVNGSGSEQGPIFLTTPPGYLGVPPID